jgi:hypothetical protein
MADRFEQLLIDHQRDAAVMRYLTADKNVCRGRQMFRAAFMGGAPAPYGLHKYLREKYPIPLCGDLDHG